MSILMNHKVSLHPLPFFRLSLGIALTYLSMMVLVPLIFLILFTFNVPFDQWVQELSNPRVIYAFKISVLTSFSAAFINMIMGLLVAWILVRYEFPGKRIIDSLIDLPFALPTAVAGIALTTLYAQNGFFGQWVSFKIAYTPIGIIIALLFIGLPFVVRSVQPVLKSLPPDLEEVAFTLGASRLQVLIKVIIPLLMPALLSGFTMAFARGLGEYGSVIFIAGNIPMKSETLPFVVSSKLDQHEIYGAAVIALAMLLLSFSMLIVMNYLQRKNRSFTQ